MVFVSVNQESVLVYSVLHLSHSILKAHGVPRLAIIEDGMDIGLWFAAHA